MVADVVGPCVPRPYRPALGLETALGEIARQSGRLYDPEVVGACIGLFQEGGYAFIQAPH